MPINIQAPLSTYCNFLSSWVFHNPILMSNPLTFVFIMALIPDVFLPFTNTSFFMSILVNADNAIPIIIVATTGEVIGEIVLYYLAKRGSELLLKKEKKKEIEVKKFIHRYSWVIFVFAPFIPIGTDAIVIFAGIKHVKIFHFILPMSVGFVLKNIVTIVLALQGSALISQIFSLCGVS